jgi:hypothetical protein
MPSPIHESTAAAIEWWAGLPERRRRQLAGLLNSREYVALPRSKQGWLDLRDLARLCVKMLLDATAPGPDGKPESIDTVVRNLLAAASAPPLKVGVRPSSFPDPNVPLPDPKISEPTEDPHDYGEP